MDTITLYHKTTCSKSRGAREILDEKGIEYEDVQFFNAPLTPETLKDILKKLGITAHELLRTKEEMYKELGIVDKNLSEDELVDLMIRYPDLMERPIVVKGDRAIIARPSQKVLEIL